MASTSMASTSMASTRTTAEKVGYRERNRAIIATSSRRVRQCSSRFPSPTHSRRDASRMSVSVRAGFKFNDFCRDKVSTPKVREVTEDDKVYKLTFVGEGDEEIVVDCPEVSEHT